MTKITKSLMMVALAGVVAFAPVSQADAKHHHSNTIVAAAVGGAVAGLVSGVVQSAFAPTSTVVVEQPTIVTQPVYIEQEPVVVYRPYRRPLPHRYTRRYYRYY